MILKLHFLVEKTLNLQKDAFVNEMIDYMNRQK